MKLLKNVGFFRELPYGDKDGLSLRNSVNAFPQENEDKIVKYLRSGILFVACMGITTDVLDQTSDFVTSPHIITDGDWAWFNDLSYYVERYHCRMPEDFFIHMQSNNWMVPSDEEIDLLELEIQ